jgi:hypothetical protein
MPRDESVTDEFIERLKTGFAAAADQVRSALSWPETQKQMVTGTYAYKVALERADEGWTREEIERELSLRSVFGQLPNPIQVIGNRRPDEGPDSE